MGSLQPKPDTSGRAGDTSPTPLHFLRSSVWCVCVRGSGSGAGWGGWADDWMDPVGSCEVVRVEAD